MDYLKVKVSFTYSMFDARGLLKLGRFSGEDLAFSSWWSSLSGKTSVSRRMDRLIDMATDAKRAMRPKTLVIPPLLLSLSQILLLRLSPEICRLPHSGIRREDCEGTSYYSTIFETSIAVSKLTSVGFFTLLEWITWWVWPN